MDQVEIVAAWIGIAGAGAVGVVGWVFAGLANRRAKESNKLAQAANELAKDAVRRAAEANEIAVNANKLSEQSNAIARAESAKRADPSHVDWVAKWDKEAGVARITNRGRDDAFKASVIVTGREVDEVVWGAERLPRGAEVVVPFPEIADYREQHRFREEATLAKARRGHQLIVYPQFGHTYELDIRWVTELGNPGLQTVKLFVS